MNTLVAIFAVTTADNHWVEKDATDRASHPKR